VRVLGLCGGSTRDIYDGLRWAAGLPVAGLPTNPNPAKIINMSLGGYRGGRCRDTDPVAQAAINDVVRRGAIVVVAAGNSNRDAINFAPSSCDNTITVAATDYNNRPTGYTNYGNFVDIAAPGGNTSTDIDNDGYVDGVLSPLWNASGSQANYTFYQGTSMAAPHVAGIVSLMLARNPNLTFSNIYNILTSTATRISCPNGCGSGLVNAAKAVQNSR
jgi:serine protease